MRSARMFLTGIIVLTVLVTLLSLFLSSKVKVTREIIIAAPADSIKMMIADLNFWPQWYAPLTTSVISKPTVIKSTGAITWIGNDGNKQMVQLTVVDTLGVEAVISNNNHTLWSAFLLHPIDNGNKTRVEWQALIDLGWLPWKKFSGIFTEKLTAPAMESSLQNLKTMCESRRLVVDLQQLPYK